MKKIFVFSFLLLIIVFTLGITTVIAFEPSDTGLNATADASGFDVGASGNLTLLVGRIINGVLALVGFVLMILIIYGGVLYMLAGEDSKNITKAKAYLTNSIIGVIIIGLAYAISTQVIQLIINVQQ